MLFDTDFRHKFCVTIISSHQMHEAINKIYKYKNCVLIAGALPAEIECDTQAF